MRGFIPAFSLLERFLFEGGTNGVLAVGCVTRTDRDLVCRAIVVTVVVFAVFDVATDARNVLRGIAFAFE